MAGSIKVFISYGREDESAARRLFGDLKKAGLDPWFDKESLLPGQNWRSAIRQAIGESGYFLALLSTKSVARRGFVQKEIKEGLSMLEEFPEGDIFLIPVRLDDCKPPYQILHDLQWVDMFPSWDEGLRRLRRAISPFKTVRGKTPMQKVCVVVCDFRNFSSSASEAYVGERYSEYILQELLKDVGMKIQVHGSWRGTRRPSTEAPFNPYPGRTFDIGITTRGNEESGGYNKYEYEREEQNLILRDKIGIYIQPVRSGSFDLREMVRMPQFSNHYDGCCVIAGSIENGQRSDYKALVRLIWLSGLDECTWFVIESPFDKEDMVENAIKMSKTISNSLTSHLKHD